MDESSCLVEKPSLSHALSRHGFLVESHDNIQKNEEYCTLCLNSNDYNYFQ